MRRQNPILLELQGVDLVLQLAGRERPCGFRCALNDDRRGLPALSDETIKHAMAVSAIVRELAPVAVRRTVTLAMSVRNGAPQYDRRAIAKALGRSEPQITRYLRDGLTQVKRALELAELREMAADQGAIKLRLTA